MLLDLLANQPQTDFWHDPVILTVVGSIATIFAGLIGAFVTYWVFRKQKTKKELSYQVISDAPIASVNKDFEHRVTIQFDGQPVKDVRQVVLKLRNSGNVAVKREDYDELMQFVFPGNELMNISIIATEPENLFHSLDRQLFRFAQISNQNTKKDTRDTAVLAKFLLNPKQSITITFLLNATHSNLEVKGRIVDGEIVEYSNKSTSMVAWEYFGFVFLFLTFFSSLIVLLAVPPANFVRGLVIAGITFIILVFYICVLTLQGKMKIVGK